MNYFCGVLNLLKLSVVLLVKIRGYEAFVMSCGHYWSTCVPQSWALGRLAVTRPDSHFGQQQPEPVWPGLAGPSPVCLGSVSRV